MTEYTNMQWPIGGVESVLACPICHYLEKTPMHDDLSDLTFNAAPGRWTMVRCNNCRTGYLDPRPTAETIGLAYTNYYTHQKTGANKASLLSRFRIGVAESFANHQFGTHFNGAIPLGYVATWFLPRLRRYLKVRYGRHLDRPSKGIRRLLDIGCGNGEFLACASAMGWSAEGIDVDPAAVAAAQAAGHSVRLASIDDPSLKANSYAQITLSHVIEHVFSPRELLEKCASLLAPDGRLWLQTPNINSFGHRVFGSAWRGLEPPRHLILLNRSALHNLLLEAGFENIEFRAHPAVPLFIWEESRQIHRRMLHTHKDGILRRLGRWLPTAVIADYWSIVRPDSSEFLTCTATRRIHSIPRHESA